jgi:hypothetical protein
MAREFVARQQTKKSSPAVQLHMYLALHTLCVERFRLLIMQLQVRYFCVIHGVQVETNLKWRLQVLLKCEGSSPVCFGSVSSLVFQVQSFTGWFVSQMLSMTCCYP